MIVGPTDGLISSMTESCLQATYGDRPGFCLNFVKNIISWKFNTYMTDVRSGGRIDGLTDGHALI